MEIRYKRIETVQFIRIKNGLQSRFENKKIIRGRGVSK